MAVHPDDERAVLHHEPAVLGRHLEKSWRTLDSIDVMMEKVMESQRHFPSSVMPLIKTLMSQGACLTTESRH